MVTPTRVAFAPMQLVRLHIADRSITKVIGMPDHFTWKLENGYLFFDASMGGTFCLIDEYKTPYDITAHPDKNGGSSIRIPALAPPLTHQDIARFLQSPHRWHYHHIYANTSSNALPMETLNMDPNNSVIIASNHLLHPGEITHYFIAPRVTIKRVILMLTPLA